LWTLGGFGRYLEGVREKERGEGRGEREEEGVEGEERGGVRRKQESEDRGEERA
jgi:hypothetical protein